MPGTPKTEDAPDEAHTQHRRQASAAGPAVSACLPGDLIYDLRAGGDCYTISASFTDKVLAELERRAGPLLSGYGQYVQMNLREPQRSRGEYALDLLVLGMALGRYGAASERTPGWALAVSQELLWRRAGWLFLRPFADWVRAALYHFFLAPGVGEKSTPPERAFAKLPRIIGWMQATGELDQESLRLDNSEDFFDTISHEEAAKWCEAAVEAFDWFELEAQAALGSFTQGVQPFLAKQAAKFSLRRDQLLRGKRPVEYHLAMVAAELMNRGFRESFDQTRHKAVLLPACMRGARSAHCLTPFLGTDIVCAGCDPGCAVNRISKRMKKLDVPVFLVPHGSGFSRWLERWQGESEVGVIAAACLLNILPGGYEMRARRIAGQCVPLNFPGCTRHWCEHSISTCLDEDRLVRIATGVAT